MLLDHAPGHELSWLVFVMFNKKPLGDAVLDFVGVGKRGVGIEADEALKIVDAADEAVGNFRLDGVLVFAPGLGPVKIALQRWRAKLQCEFAVVAGDWLNA